MRVDFLAVLFFPISCSAARALRVILRDQIHPEKLVVGRYEVDSRQGNVADLDILVAPLAEEEDGLVVEVSNLLRQLNGLNFPGVGHLDCRGGGGGKDDRVVEGG